MIRMLLQFPGDEDWSDVSDLVRPYSYHQSNRLINDSLESVVDTASVVLRYDQLITARIMACSAGTRILCAVLDENEQPLFTGYIAPGLRQQKGKRVEDLSLEIRDLSWKLDLPMLNDLQLPTSIADPPVTVRALYEGIILAAGYSMSDIYNDGIAASETIQMVSVAAGDCTYRELLDAILRDYGYVFSMTADGNFYLYKWNQNSYAVSGAVNKELSVVHPLEVSKRDTEHDGIKLIWSGVETLEHVRLFSANLPVGEDRSTSGISILPDRYYPEEGDVVETYQNFQTDWLDEPYLSRKSRVRNRDITLLSSENHQLVVNSDLGISVDVELHDKHQSRVLFHNYTEESKKLYVFEIYGRALFRSSKRETVIPVGAGNPQEISTEHLYDQVAADSLANGLYRNQQYGNVSYAFTLREKIYAPGDVVEIIQDDPALQTEVLITEVSWTDGRDGFRYTAKGVSSFGDIESITKAYQAAKSGKGEKGDAAIHVEIISHHGTIFRPAVVNTTLEAKVYQSGVDITTQYADADFRWVRTSEDNQADAVWNSAHYSTGGKTLQITDEDVYGRAVFFCELLSAI